MITVFTPSFADEANTNAQNLTVKEVVSRLPPERFKVILLGSGAPDPRIAARENTHILRSTRHGNAARWLTRCCPQKSTFISSRARGLWIAHFYFCGMHWDFLSRW